MTRIALRYGFKAQAERWAKEFRENMKLHPCAPLDAFKLAAFLKIDVYKSSDFFTSQHEINLLCGTGADGEWSALTMTTEKGNRIIIHNEYHSDPRQQSDLMHELAHVICNHTIHENTYDFEIPYGMRHFNEAQEEEAKCLGATLQLPTPSLLWARKRNMTYDDIAAHFNASLDMVTYRMNLTGIAKRYKIKVDA